MYASTLESSGTRAPWWKADLLLDWSRKKKVRSRGQTLQPLISGSQRDQCCLCSVVWNGLSWQQSFLPDRPRCGIDLCFCFMPGFPEKVEMFENAGGVCGDRGMSVHLYPCVCVCVNGWAGIRSFSPHKNWDRPIKKSLVMWNPAKSNYNIFPLVHWVDFLVNLTQLVMHISSFFRFFPLFCCWPSASAQNESLCLAVFPGNKTSGVLWWMEKNVLHATVRGWM